MKTNTIKSTWRLFVTTLFLTISLFGQTATAPSGSGTSSDPYLIATLDNLYWMSQNSGEWSKYYEQTADIDASSTSAWDSDQGWTPIGFSGTYDGGNHTIDQLTINRPSLGGVGFFASTSNATVKDLGLTNVDVTGSYYTGALSGSDNSSTITGCFTTGSVTADYLIGGIVGNATSTAISNSYSTVTVTAGYYAGGLFGQTGGTPTMTNCYYAGLCTADYLEGGLIGGNGTTTTVTGSFWDTDISDQPSTIGGGTGYTTAEMTAANIYINAGWDFEIETVNGSDDIWDMDNANTTVNSGYPFFSWENGSTVLYDLPVVITAISDITTQTTADQVITITATDADGGSTTFAASSSDEAVATVSISGTSTSGTTTTATLTITNVSEGISTITVTASNPNSPMGSTTFMYQNDVTPPTASLAYTISGSSVASVDVGDVVLITATFNENIADSPVMQISGSGVNTINATDMSKVSATSYTYSWTVASGSGTQTWALETGTDLSGNVITSAPTSGSIIPMRVAPTGTGTETDPYLIATLENLLWFSHTSGEWSKYYEQTADIDASSTSAWDSDQGWTPIGFSGTYDGGNHTIDQLTINRPSLGGVGFFASTSNATVKDLGLTNVDVTGSYFTGALSGSDNSSTITGCFTTGSVTADYYIGGIVGHASTTTISNSYSTVTVTAGYYAGGLFGQTGGTPTMTNCYYAGLCTADYLEGGLIGGNGTTTTVTGSFWDTDISDQPSTIGGGTGKTTAEMKDIATYTSTATTGLSTAWDFTGTQNDDSGNNDYWVLYPEIYPIFTWQNGMPYFSSISSSSINVNGGNYDSTYTVAFTGTDPNGEVLSYSADYSGSGSVSLSVSAGTQSGNDTPGTLLVTPSEEGSGTITISAQDSSNTVTMTIEYLDDRTYDSFRLESLGSLIAWYDGNDPHGTGSVSVGDEIETWVDKSENNIHVTQSESSKRPVVVAEGNSHSVQFDGNDMLGVDNATMEQAFGEMTIISVVKSSVSGYKNIMGRESAVWEYQWHGSAKLNMYIAYSEQDGSSNTYPFDGQARIGIFRYHDANDALDQWIDGTSTYTSNHNKTIPSSTNDFYIGARMGTSEFFNGEMLELIIFSEYLTNTNRERVENYLANKWGLDGDDLEPEDGETFEVINVAPSLGSLVDGNINEDTTSEIILSATDADGDTLTYSASSDTTAVTATMSNDTLTLTPAVNWNGIADITVIVSDGSLSDTTSFTLTVNAVNDAPVVSAPVPDVSIDEDDFGAVIITALEAYFDDVDEDDVLSFDASALGAGLDSLSLSDDGMATMGRIVNYGSAKIMTIKRSVKKNSQGKSFTFGQSEDKSALMDIVAINNPGREGRSSSRTDSTSLIVYPTEDFFGNVDIVITATDTSGEMASDTLNLSIENLNDAPSLAALADASTDEEMASVRVISATDADGDMLTYSASSDTTAVTATVSNDTLTITPAVNWNGTADITVTVTDGALSDEETFILTVNAVNDAPVVSAPVPDVSIDEDDFGAVIVTALEAYFDDVDEDDILTFDANALGAGLDSLSLSDDGMATMERFVNYGSAKIMTIKRSVKKNSQGKSFTFGQSEDKSALLDIGAINNPGREGISSSRTDSTSLIVYPTEDFVGNVEIVITATDTSGEFAKDTLMLTIENMNDAPFVYQSMSDIEVDEDHAPMILLIGGVFDDMDIIHGDSLVITALSADTAMVTIHADSNDVPHVRFEENAFGHVQVIVTATDMEGLSVDDTVDVIIHPVNDYPNDFSLVESDSMITITSANVSTGRLMFNWEEAVDVDGDTINYHFTATLSIGTHTEDHDTTVMVLEFAGLDYQSLYNKIWALQLTSAELEWNVYADDGHVSVPAVNGPLTFSIDVSSLSIDDEVIPDVFALHQNYPNPFNPVTNIRFDVPEQSLVKMEIFNILGQRVKTLANQQMNAGFHSIQWNGTNDHGKPLSSGMYIYTINAGKFHAVKKLVFMK